MSDIVSKLPDVASCATLELSPDGSNELDTAFNLGSDIEYDFAPDVSPELDLSFNLYSDIESEIETSIDIKVVSEDDKPKMLAVYAKCDCCNIHKINKPLVYAPWVDLQCSKGGKYCSKMSNKDAEGYVMCECYCRFNARAVCRSHPDYKGSFKPELHV